MKTQSYIIAYSCLPQRNDAITAREEELRKITLICRGNKTLKIEKVFTDNPKTHLADLSPLCTDGKFGCQFGFKSGDLSLILCAFFLCIRSLPGVITRRHLQRRSKLSAINDSFSHIAFSITLYENYVHYYTTI